MEVRREGHGDGDTKKINGNKKEDGIGREVI